MYKQTFNVKIVHFKRFVRKAYAAFNSMHRVINIGVVSGCVLAFAHITETSAQNKRVIGNDSVSNGTGLPITEQKLEEVMVTASHIGIPIAQTPKLVTIITKEQITSSPAKSVQELLAYVANVDILQRGGHGVQADVSICGGSFDQTAVLINGVNHSNPHTGHFSLDLPINLSDIERIEIVHGPSGLIYGSSAFSGGINIITKKDATEKVYLHAGKGMHNLKELEIRSATRIGIATHSLSVGYKSSEGYQYNTDYDMYNILWQTCLSWNNSKTDIQLGYNDKAYGSNSFYHPEGADQYEKKDTYRATFKGEFGSTLKFIPILYWTRNHDQYEWVKNSPTGRNNHQGDTYGTNCILQYVSLLGITSFGNEWRKEDILSSKLGKETIKFYGKDGIYNHYDDRINISTTLEHTFKSNKWIFSVGGLLNHNTFIGNQYGFYPSISVSYRPIERMKIASSWNHSTRMPTFTDLYYNTNTHQAGENLKPEKSESVDINFNYCTHFATANITGFLFWGRDIIDWYKPINEEKYRSANFATVNTQGVDINLYFRLAEIIPILSSTSNLSIGYAHLWQNSSTDSTEISALEYLRDKFTVQFNHSIYRNFYAGWYFRFQNRIGSYQKAENNKYCKDEQGNFIIEDYSPFSTLDLKLSYEYKNWIFNISLNNLYNTRYADLGNILQPGFWLTGGVSCTIH